MASLEDLERRILVIERRLNIAAPDPAKQAKKQRQYAPNDGSKSEWAQTPEGCEWWSKSWLDEEKAPWE